ncbi:MAG: hypothetical protein AAFZ92_11210 [Pseudomonadota bacterium]
MSRLAWKNPLAAQLTDQWVAKHAVNSALQALHRLLPTVYEGRLCSGNTVVSEKSYYDKRLRFYPSPG